MRILVDHDAEEYVREIVRQADGEVGGIGYVEQLGPGEFFISEFVLLEQDAGVAHVDFEGDSYIKEITRAATGGREDELRLSWHSHGGMDTYFSTTDDKGVEEYAQLGMPWLISLVFNHAGDTSSRIDIFDSSVVSQITIRDLDYEVGISDTSVSERVEADLKRLVKNKTAEKWNKQAWNKVTKEYSNKNNKNQIEPLYGPNLVGNPLLDGDIEWDDDIKWDDKDYDAIATQLASMGIDPKKVTDEELEDVKDIMESNDGLTSLP